MNQERAVRDDIRALIRGDVSLAAFERSIGLKSQCMFRDGSSEGDIRLIAAANLLISELHDNIINLQEFRDEVAALINAAIEAVPVQRVRIWDSLSRNAPVKVSLNFDPEPAWPIVTSVAQRPRWWLQPVMGEL